jgi:hypothetical protein
MRSAEVGPDFGIPCLGNETTSAFFFSPEVFTRRFDLLPFFL